MSQLEQVQGWLDEIDEAEDAVSYLKGKISSKKEELQNTFGVSTIAQAQKLYKEMSADITALQEEIDTSVTELQEKFDAVGVE